MFSNSFLMIVYVRFRLMKVKQLYGKDLCQPMSLFTKNCYQ